MNKKIEEVKMKKDKKEKTYKKKKDAIDALKDKECCVYDKDKKKYVNIKVFSSFKDPFDYDYKAGIALMLFCGVIIMSLGGIIAGIVGSAVIGILHYCITYRRSI